MNSALDRKSTRLNSSHLVISYAVFCLKKKTHVGEQLIPVPIPVAFIDVRRAARPRLGKRSDSGAWLGQLLFFFKDTATTEIYTLSLHDALPIYITETVRTLAHMARFVIADITDAKSIDRKSTRLNSSHLVISYAVFCLKKT